MRLRTRVFLLILFPVWMHALLARAQDPSQPAAERTVRSRKCSSVELAYGNDLLRGTLDANENFLPQIRWASIPRAAIGAFVEAVVN